MKFETPLSDRLIELSGHLTTQELCPNNLHLKNLEAERGFEAGSVAKGKINRKTRFTMG
jgi:hypothetical protein